MNAQEIAQDFFSRMSDGDAASFCTVGWHSRVAEAIYVGVITGVHEHVDVDLVLEHIYDLCH